MAARAAAPTDGLDEEAVAAGLVDVANGALSCEDAAEGLVQGAYAGGGKDNITALVLQVPEGSSSRP